MLIQEKIGHIASFPADGRAIDWLELEWFEAGKRILRKRTVAGRDLALKFLRESPGLTQGDVLYAGEKELIVVGILPCASIAIYPSSVYEIASVCYEIGNKHLPLFMEEEALLVAYEAPLFRQLQAQGYDVRKEDRKLLNSLQTTVTAHGHTGRGDGSLLTKILQLTNPASSSPASSNPAP